MTRRLALFAGTFDPVTRGHEDVIRRGARLFDAVLVCVAPDAPRAWLPQALRVQLLRDEVADLEHVEVEPFDGLLTHVAVEREAVALLRGVRSVRDFEYEMEMAFANRDLAPHVETLFLPPSAKTALVSSSLVREVARLGGDVSAWVSPAVADALKHRAAAT